MENLKLKEFVEQTFTSEKELTLWLANSTNLNALKEKYPPATYNAHIDLINKQIVINSK